MKFLEEEEERGMSLVEDSKPSFVVISDEPVKPEKPHLFLEKFREGLPKETQETLFKIPEIQLLDKLWNHIDFFPYAKYLLRDRDREDYYNMPLGDQMKALTWESVGAGIWLAAGPVMKGIGKGVKWTGRGIRAARGIL